MYKLSYNTDNMIENLKKIGLSDYEAQVFEVLANNSPSNATFIAKKCNLSRSSVYTTLGALISKGLVGTTFKNDVKQFVVNGYQALEGLVNKEEESLNTKKKVLVRIKEEYDKREEVSLNLPQIIIFEGQEGLKKIYLSMLRQAKENSTLYLIRDEFVWTKDWEFIFNDDWDERVKRFKKNKNIKTKVLINDSKLEKSKVDDYKSKKHLVFNFIPKNTKVKNFACYILDDMLSILSLENNNLVGIKITNRNIADNFKSLLFGNL